MKLRATLHAHGQHDDLLPVVKSVGGHYWLDTGDLTIHVRDLDQLELFANDILAQCQLHRMKADL